MTPLKTTLMVIPLLLLTGLGACTPSVSDQGLCDGLRPLAKAHSASLVASGEVLLKDAPKVLVTGDNLLSGLRGGCGK